MCGEKLTVELALGKVGEFSIRDAYFSLENDKLNLSYNSKRYQLTAQESDRKQDYVYEAPESITFTIPRNAPLGSYALTAKTYIGSEKSETESHFFDIVSCPAVAANQGTSSTNTPTQNQSATRNTTTASATTSATPSSAASIATNASKIGTENKKVSIDSVDAPLNTRTIAIVASVIVIILLVLLLGILISLLSKGESASSRAVSVISVRKNGRDNTSLSTKSRKK